MIKMGLIGLGSMGLNHLRILKIIKNVIHIYVYDKKHLDLIENDNHDKITIIRDWKKFVECCDAYIICTSTNTHLGIIKKLPFSNKKILVEKPIVSSSQEANELIALGSLDNIKVGYLERYNAAIKTFFQIKKLNELKINSVSIKRKSFASSRITDVGVITDLMVHDLDILKHLFGVDLTEDASNIQSYKVGNLRSEDICLAHFELCNGATKTLISLEASRISHTRERSMIIDTNSGYFVLDFLNQSLTMTEQNRNFRKNRSVQITDIPVLELEETTFLVRRNEPLYEELMSFCDFVNNNTDDGILASAEDALDTTNFAEHLINA